MKVFFKETLAQRIDALVHKAIKEGKQPVAAFVPVDELRKDKSISGRYRIYSVMPTLYPSFGLSGKVRFSTIQVEISPSVSDKDIRITSKPTVSNQVCDKIQEAAEAQREIDYIELNSVEHALLHNELSGGITSPFYRKRTPTSGSFMTLYGVRLEVEGSEDY